MATFQERFNILFENSKLSQEEFGKQINASKSQIFNWRNGRGEPDTEMLKTIARFRNVRIEWLLGEGEDNENDNNTINYSNQETYNLLPLVMEKMETMQWNEEEKKAVDKMKKMPLNEQQEIVAESLMELIKQYNGLSAKNQEAIATIIKSLYLSEK